MHILWQSEKGQETDMSSTEDYLDSLLANAKKNSKTQSGNKRNAESLCFLLAIMGKGITLTAGEAWELW